MGSLFSAVAMASVMAATPAANPQAAGAATPAAQQVVVNQRLHATRWRLVALDGRAAAAASAPLPPVQLVLSPKNRRLSGWTGCAALQGRYVQRGIRLTLTPVEPPQPGPSACPADAASLQAGFLAMLGRTDAYRIEGDRLSLLEGDAVQAQFDAVRR